jgi:hypothetical protein
MSNAKAQMSNLVLGFGHLDFRRGAAAKGEKSEDV